MWYVGALMAALSLLLLTFQIVDLRRGTATKRPSGRLLQGISLLLAVVNVPIGALVALGDANLGPWAVGNGYAVLGLLTCGVQLAVLAIALALWLLARPAAARSKAVKVGIVLSWIVVAGVGVCYGSFAGM